ncbi:MAG TPA: hypothetical protein EYG57_04530 [Planctomycetes bacterium]|nr:hypothetical protein [Planctomycetota bacterium]
MKIPNSFVWILSFVLAAHGLPASAANGEDSKLQDPKLQDRIENAIQRLASNQFDVRQLATKELQHVGATAIPALEKAAKSSDREMRTRSLDVLRTQLRGSDPKVAAEASATLKRLASDSSHPSGRLAATILEDRVEKVRAALNQRAMVMKQLQGRQALIFQPQRMAFRPPVPLPRGIRGGGNATITVSDNRHGRLRIQVVNGKVKLLEVQVPNGEKKTYNDLNRVKTEHPQLFRRYETIARRNNYPLPK